MAPSTSRKKSLKPKRHHFYSVLLFILGSLFPPLAIAARFGIGTDFWLNLFLTLAGYIPGHVHNFYCQNVRNNKTHQRTPKWAQRYGLVSTSGLKKKERKNEWAVRYGERNPHSTLEGQAYEDGQEPVAGADDLGEGRTARQRASGSNGDGLWDANDESFYGQRDDSSSTGAGGGGRWHYPANFDDAIPAEPRKSKKKKDKKDRWARTEDAYSINEEAGAGRRKKKKSRAPDEYSDRSGSTTAFPEDAEGGLYASARVDEPPREGQRTPRANGGEPTNEFEHQF